MRQWKPRTATTTRETEARNSKKEKKKKTSIRSTRARSASAALPVFSSSIGATSDLQSGEDSIIGDSPDEDAVIVGTDDATNSVGDGEQPNFSGEGETESCLIIIMGVVGVDGV